MKSRLHAIRASQGLFGAQTSRHQGTYLDIYQGGRRGSSLERRAGRFDTSISD